MRLGRAACGGSAAYGEPLCAFSGTHTRTAAASRTRNAHLRPSMLVASKPSTRRSVYIRAASSTRLKPPLNKKNGRRRGLRAFAAENNTYTNPVLENKQTFDTAQRYLKLQNSSKSDTKILKTAQDTPWTGPTSTEPLPLAM